MRRSVVWRMSSAGARSLSAVGMARYGRIAQSHQSVRPHVSVPQSTSCAPRRRSVGGNRTMRDSVGFSRADVIVLRLPRQRRSTLRTPRNKSAKSPLLKVDVEPQRVVVTHESLDLGQAPAGRTRCMSAAHRAARRTPPRPRAQRAAA
jgi:hypothetical protein